MSRLRHEKSRHHKMAGTLTGVHRLEVDKPHPFKPDEEKKHGGKAHRVDGGSCKSKLGRKRGGHVKKKSDGGNVTTVGKTKGTGPDDFPTVSGKPLLAESKYNAPADKYFALPAKSYGLFGAPSKEKSEDRLSRAKGGKVVGQDGKSSHHGTDDTHDRGLKYASHVQNVPMAGTRSGYGGKFAVGKGHIEDSLKDGGKVKWLSRAIKHPGALHKELHVPSGEKIPEKKLEKASHSSNPTLRRRANLAKTMKGFHH